MITCTLREAMKKRLLLIDDDIFLERLYDINKKVIYLDNDTYRMLSLESYFQYISENSSKPYFCFSNPKSKKTVSIRAKIIESPKEENCITVRLSIENILHNDELNSKIINGLLSDEALGIKAYLDVDSDTNFITFLVMLSLNLIVKFEGDAQKPYICIPEHKAYSVD